MSDNYVLISGASSGIGQGIAQRLAGSWKLVLAGRNLEKLEATRKSCSSPDQHLVWVQDLTQPAIIGESVASFLSSKGISVGHFVHSAGVIELQALRTVQMPDLMRTFNVNFFSAVEIIRSLLRPRINNRALKTITIVSSIATLVGAKGYSVYAASKGALNSLARSLAVELAPEIRVNCILPGSIETEGTKRYFATPEFVESIKANYPLGLGQPQDVAEMVDFIISDRAKWMTGQEIAIDGGRSIM